LVPVKSILKSFVNQDTTEDKPDSDEEDEEIKKSPAEVHITKSHEGANGGSVMTNVRSDVIPPSAELPPALPEPMASSLDAAPLDMAPLDMAPQEAVHPTPSPPTIVLEDKPTVRFGEFNAMFDTEDPDKSDMIQQDQEDHEDDPVLEILEEVGTSLSSDGDFISLDEPSTGEQMEADDYEQL
jgi:hypothetical protein